MRATTTLYFRGVPPLQAEDRMWTQSSCTPSPSSGTAKRRATQHGHAVLTLVRTAQSLWLLHKGQGRDGDATVMHSFAVKGRATKHGHGLSTWTPSPSRARPGCGRNRHALLRGQGSANRRATH